MSGCCRPGLHRPVTGMRQNHHMNDIAFSYADPSAPILKRGIIRAVEAATGQRTLKRLYLDQCQHLQVGESFWQAAMRLLALDVRFDPTALSRIPRHGPVVIIANHPYGSTVSSSPG